MSLDRNDKSLDPANSMSISPILDVREEIILKTIVEEYIKNIEPVSSRRVSKSQEVTCSSATIRNVMNDLADKSLLSQPHTSSGRIPTDEGLRYYVDHFVSFNKEQYNNAGLAQQLKIEDKAIKATQGVSLHDKMNYLATRIGEITKQIGIISVPNVAKIASVKKVYFTKMTDRQVLVIMELSSGEINNVMTTFDVDIPAELLMKVSNFLNEQLQNNRSLGDIKALINGEIKRNSDELLNIQNGQIITQTINTISDSTGANKYEMLINGISNIFDNPEFRESSTVKALMQSIEEKRLLNNIIDKCVDESGVKFFIGSELGEEATKEYGFVSRSFSDGNEIIGFVGVLGPRRMPYKNIAPIVDLTAGIIGDILNSNNK